MNKNVQFITKTAMLLALAVLFQSLRVIVPMPPTVSQFVIGSLVNLVLIVAGVTVGAKGGLAVAILAPIISFLQGFIANPVLVPFVALGNMVIVLAAALFYDSNKYMAIAVGAVAKFAVLYLTIVKYAFPVLIAPGLKAPQVSKMAAALTYQFSWPQIVTAVLGGLLAILILPLLTKAAPAPRKVIQ